jgi:hypothetical protein
MALQPDCTCSFDKIDREEKRNLHKRSMTGADKEEQTHAEHGDTFDTG